jgi:mono/diheme cytochrome c family protein
MNNAFKIKKLTPEEIQEITNYIQNLVDNKSFEEVEALAKTD